MKEEDIDRLFREAFHDAEETPNQSVWQKIEKKLDGQHKVNNLLPFARQLWMKYAVAAVLLASLTLGLLKLTNNISPDDTQENNLSLNTTNLPEVAPQEQSNERLYLKTDKELTAKTTSSLPVNKQDDIASRKVLDSPKRINIELKTIHLEESKPNSITVGKLSQVNSSNLPIYQVTEIENIKPLIELDEEMESMYAKTPHESPNKTIVTTLLNTISEKIEINTAKDIRFRADDEGSFRIDILNSLVKNRNKKR